MTFLLDSKNFIQLLVKQLPRNWLKRFRPMNWICKRRKVKVIMVVHQ